LWLNGTAGCLDILDGTIDDKIRHMYEFFNHDYRLLNVPKIFLRVGYEFDNPWFGYSTNPSAYQKAFRKLVQHCEDQMGYTECHDKIAFVWHSWAAPRVVKSLDEFYPGDDVVDWVGVSIFQQLYPWANSKDTSGNFAGGNKDHVVEVLQYAKRHKKRIMIAESTPFGGIDVASTDIANGYIIDPSDGRSNGDIIWNIWFQKTIDLIEEYDISMWSYINCDWDSQPMWNGIGFGDTRLSSSDVLMHKWWDKVLRKNSRFINRIEDCNHDLSTTNSEASTANIYKILPAKSFDKKVDTISRTMSSKETFAYIPCLLLILGFIAKLGILRYNKFRSRNFPTRSFSGDNHQNDYGSIQ
jgi:hypothetical protein